MPEDRLDNLLNEIRNEPVPDGEAAAAQARVWENWPRPPRRPAPNSGPTSPFTRQDAWKDRANCFWKTI